MAVTDFELVEQMHNDLMKTRNNLTTVLEPYLKAYFELDKKTVAWYDATEAEADYEFNRITNKGQFIEFVTTDYQHPEYGYQEYHYFEMPMEVVKDQQGYTAKRLQEFKRRMDQNRKVEEENKQAKIERLRKELEELEKP